MTSEFRSEEYVVLTHGRSSRNSVTEAVDEVGRWCHENSITAVLILLWDSTIVGDMYDQSLWKVSCPKERMYFKLRWEGAPFSPVDDGHG